MNNTLLKYIDFKLKKVDNEDKTKLFTELKNTENFINIIFEINNNLSKENVLLLLNNKELIKLMNEKYNFIDKDKQELFFALLESLKHMSPSFSPQNYKFLTKVMDIIKQNESKLYSVYEELDSKYKQIASFEIEYDKLILETAKLNIENEQIIDEELVNFIIKDIYIDYNYKIKLLKEINKHNKYTISSLVFMTREELKILLNKYNYNINSTKSIDMICTKYSEGTIRNILNTIKILNLKFSNETLEKILILGTSAQTIKLAYAKISSERNINLVSACGIYNFWINTPYIPSLSEIASSSVIDAKEELENVSQVVVSKKTTKTSNKEINSTEIFKTIEYLKKFPFYNKELDMMKKIIKVPVEKLQKRENLIGLYGIKSSDIEGSMTLYSPHIITILDQMIELNLQDYILNHLSALSRSQSLPIILYKNIKDGENVINIKNGNMFLDSSIVDQIGKYSDAVKDAGLVDIVVEKRTTLDKVIEQNGFDNISPNIFKESFIKYLEENYKVNELQYIIDGYIFSRKKVLRIATSLIKEINNIDYDTMVYIMSYSKIMNIKDASEIQKVLYNVYSASKEKLKN